MLYIKYILYHKMSEINTKIIKELLSNETFDQIDDKNLKQGYHRVYNDKKTELIRLAHYIDNINSGYDIGYYPSGKLQYLQYHTNGIRDGFGIRLFESGTVQFIDNHKDGVYVNYTLYTENSTIKRVKFKSNESLYILLFNNTLVPYDIKNNNLNDSISIDYETTYQLYNRLTPEELCELAEARKNISTKLNPLDEYPKELEIINKYKNVGFIENLKLKFA
jgi:hypothetical protein